MGGQDGRDELINSAKLFGTVNDPRRNSNDTTASDFINSEYEFLSFLSQYGWVVSIGMSLTCLLLSVKLIINAIKIRDTYGKLIIVCIASIYILQTASNFRQSLTMRGVITDAPIPLVTVGTIGLIVNMMCMALVLSVYRRKNSYFEIEEGVEAIE